MSVAALQPSQFKHARALSANLPEVARGYQRTLQHDPRNAVALVGMSVVALVSRQPESAVLMARSAIAQDPRMIPAWVALGQAYKACGSMDDAASAYHQAISLMR